MNTKNAPSADTYRQQLEVWSLATGRTIRAFRDYADAIAEFGSEADFGRFVREHNAEVAFPMVRQ